MLQYYEPDKDFGTPAAQSSEQVQLQIDGVDVSSGLDQEVDDVGVLMRIVGDVVELVATDQPPLVPHSNGAFPLRAGCAVTLPHPRVESRWLHAEQR